MDPRVHARALTEPVVSGQVSGEPVAPRSPGALAICGCARCAELDHRAMQDAERRSDALPRRAWHLLSHRRIRFGAPSASRSADRRLRVSGTCFVAAHAARTEQRTEVFKPVVGPPKVIPRAVLPERMQIRVVGVLDEPERRQGSPTRRGSSPDADPRRRRPGARQLVERNHPAAERLGGGA